jgi:hypothetical protein
MSDGTMELFDLESLNHMESEYGIFVSDSGKDQDKLDILKQLAQSMVQNGVPASTIAEMVDADSFSQIKEKIKAAEAQQQQLQQAQSQAEQQAKQAELAEKAKLREDDNMNKEKDRQVKIDVAKINAEAKLQSDIMKLEGTVEGDQLKHRQQDTKDLENQEKARSNKAKEELIREDQRQNAAEKGIERRAAKKEKDEDRKENEKDRDLKKKELEIKKKAANKPAPSTNNKSK